MLASGYFGFLALPQTSSEAIPVLEILAVASIATISLYIGFFGSVAGSLFALSMSSDLGLSLRDATIRAKIFKTIVDMIALVIVCKE